MDADFVIVGAGSAGCVLAARLSEDPDVRVALVEAGGPADDPAIADPAAWPTLQGSAVDWAFLTTPQAGTAGRRHGWPRGKVVGGSSCLHAMAHVRGHPSDFDGWAEEGCAGWGYRDLLPYFIRSESWPYEPSPYHGRSGPIRLMQPDEPHPITGCFRQAAAEMGLAPTDEHNGPRMTGPTLNTLTIDAGRRQSVADAYLLPVLDRPNLRLIDRSAVLDLLFDGTRCTGVLLRRGGRSERLTAARGTILAAGAIGTPTVLLRAGIGPADDLRALGLEPRLDLRGVGRNLHDHLLAGGNLYRSRRPVPPSRYQHSESLLYVAGSQADAAAPELVVACVTAPVVTECFEAPPSGTAYTLMFGFTRPRSRGRVALASADPREPPLIDPNYLAEPADRRQFGEALSLARALGGSAALGEWRDRELLPGPGLSETGNVADFLAKAAYTHHHPVGTCRMGANEDAVVGPDLKVHGVDGLYVVDASVIPTITTGPTNAAVVAIAERASDLLRGLPPLAPATRPATASA